MKKERNRPSTPEYDRGREFAIVVEGLRSEFRVFAEDLTSVKKTVEDTRNNLAMTLERVTRIEINMNRRFELVDKRFESVDKRFDTVDKRFDTVDKRFDSVENRLDRVENRLDRVDGRLDGLESARA